MLTPFEIYGIIISVLSLLSLVAIIRLKGVFDWKSSLRSRLRRVKEYSYTTNEKDASAYSYIHKTCKALYKKNYFFKTGNIDIIDYLSDIASFYHPDKKEPLYEINLGDLFCFSNIIAQNLESILNRKVLKKIAELKVKHIFIGSELFNIFTKNKFFNSFIVIWRNYSLLKIALWLNPVGLLIFLSSGLIRMSIMKLIITDFYLSAGMYALEAYSGKQTEKAFNENDFRVSKTREVSLKKQVFKDRELKKIRNSLFKESLLFGNIPSFEKWEKAVSKSAFIISSNYFTSKNPVKEAKIGLILERTAEWLTFFSKLRNKKIVKYFFNIKLSHILFAVNAKDKYTPSFLKGNNKILKRGFSAAGYSRTFLKLYKATGPYSFISAAGTEYGKNLLVFYILKSSYEKCIVEIDMIYKNSR
ncbi:MAG: hypothetical protein ACQEQS_07280 [Thermodesulfobacteriota bacterium]